MDIKCTVNGQKLKIITPLRHFPQGSDDFVRFLFTFSDDWDGLMAFAQFRQGSNYSNRYLESVTVTEDGVAHTYPSVTLPNWPKTGPLAMTLYGNGNETVIGTTNYVLMHIDATGHINGSEVSDMDETLYQQLVNRVISLEAERMRTPYVVPEMFGAAGDGESDDTTALQACADTGAPIVMTAGKTYRVTGAIEFNDGCVIKGNDATIAWDGNGRGSHRCVIYAAGDIDVCDLKINGNSNIDIGFYVYAKSYQDDGQTLFVIDDHVNFSRCEFYGFKSVDYIPSGGSGYNVAGIVSNSRALIHSLNQCYIHDCVTGASTFNGSKSTAGAIFSNANKTEIKNCTFENIKNPLVYTYGDVAYDFGDADGINWHGVSSEEPDAATLIATQNRFINCSGRGIKALGNLVAANNYGYCNDLLLWKNFRFIDVQFGFGELDGNTMEFGTIPSYVRGGVTVYSGGSRVYAQHTYRKYRPTDDPTPKDRPGAFRCINGVYINTVYAFIVADTDNASGDYIIDLVNNRGTATCFVLYDITHSTSYGRFNIIDNVGGNSIENFFLTRDATTSVRIRAINMARNTLNNGTFVNPLPLSEYSLNFSAVQGEGETLNYKDCVEQLATFLHSQIAPLQIGIVYSGVLTKPGTGSGAFSVVKLPNSDNMRGTWDVAQYHFSFVVQYSGDTQTVTVYRFTGEAVT